MSNFLQLSSSDFLNLSTKIDDVEYFPLVFSQKNITTLSNFIKSEIRSNWNSSNCMIRKMDLKKEVISPLLYRPYFTPRNINNHNYISYYLRRPFFTLKWEQGLLFKSTSRYGGGSHGLIGYLALNTKYIKALRDYYYNFPHIHRSYNKGEFTRILLNILSWPENALIDPSLSASSHNNRSLVSTSNRFNASLDFTSLRSRAVEGPLFINRTAYEVFAVSKIHMLRHGLVFIHTPDFDSLDSTSKEFALMMNPLPIEVSREEFAKIALTPEQIKKNLLREKIDVLGDLDEAEKQIREDARKLAMELFKLKEKEEEPGKKGAKIISELDELFDPDSDITLNDFSETAASTQVTRFTNTITANSDTHLF